MINAKSQVRGWLITNLFGKNKLSIDYLKCWVNCLLSKQMAEYHFMSMGLVDIGERPDITRHLGRHKIIRTQAKYVVNRLLLVKYGLLDLLFIDEIFDWILRMAPMGIQYPELIRDDTWNVYDNSKVFNSKNVRKQTQQKYNSNWSETIQECIWYEI